MRGGSNIESHSANLRRNADGIGLELFSSSHPKSISFTFTLIEVTGKFVKLFFCQRNHIRIQEKSLVTIKMHWNRERITPPLAYEKY